MTRTVARAGRRDAVDRHDGSVCGECGFRTRAARRLHRHAARREKGLRGKRYEEAFHAFQRTARAGDKESQSAIGRMYLLGQGVTRNDLSGYAWLKVAAETKMRGYQSIVEKLEQAMTPAQRAVADPQAATLVSQYGLRATNMSCTPASSRGGLIKDGIVCTPRSEGMQVLLRRCFAENPVAAK